MTTLDDSPVRTGAPPVDEGGDWRHRAACRDEDPELFFPNGSTGQALVQIEDAKAVCRRCDVVDQCLQWALEANQDAGVWGAISEDERRALKRRASRQGSSLDRELARLRHEGDRGARVESPDTAPATPTPVKAAAARPGPPTGLFVAQVSDEGPDGEALRARVLGAVADGLGRKGVGLRFGVSEQAARSALQWLYRSLGASGAEASSVAVAQGHQRGLLAGRGAVEAPRLTFGDVRVLRLMALGRSNPEIGEAMGVPADAARVEVIRLLRLFGVSGRAALVDAGFRCGALPAASSSNGCAS